MIIHRQAVLLVIVLGPGILEPRVNLVNTVELHIKNRYNVLKRDLTSNFLLPPGML